MNKKKMNFIRNDKWFFFLISIIAFLFFLYPSVTNAQIQNAFSSQFHSLENSFGGRMGIMVKNLKTGEILSYKAKEKFPTASVIKLPIIVEYFYQVHKRKIAPTQKMVLADSNKWGGSGLYQYFSGRTEQQLIDAVMMMITISDNTATNIDWNSFPGGQWARIFLKNSPFPHPSRKDGYQYQDKFFPYDPHYSDSSAVVVIPKGFFQNNNAVDLIVHFHGWNNDVLNVMEQFDMVQQLIASKKNAILIFAQGPYRAADSAGGKMEDEGGLQRFIEEILQILKAENRIESNQTGQIIISAHSGGYRPAILSLARGNLENNIKELFLFDAFYALTDQIIPWLKQDSKNRLQSIYTEHLAEEHQNFINLLKKENLTCSDHFNPATQIILSPTDVCHNCVIENTFQLWLEGSCLSNRKLP